MTTPTPTTAAVADVLRKAADLIEPKGAWTQAASSKTADGRLVDQSDPEAVCFCAVGAINRIVGVPMGVSASKCPMFYEVRDAFAKVTGEWPMPWNDAEGRTQAEVVAALRAAADAVQS